MICLSWNCRGGLGNTSAVCALKELIIANRHDIIFLCETLIHVNKVKEIKVQFGNEGCVSTDKLGQSNGLAAIWNNTFSISITGFSSHFIDMDVISGSVT